MKEQIKALEAALANGAEFALETFDRLLADDSLRRKDLLQLQSNFSQANRSFLSGRLGPDLFFKESAKVAAALSNLIPLLHSGDFKSEVAKLEAHNRKINNEQEVKFKIPAREGISLLQNAIAEIPIPSEMGILDTINCNRRQVSNDFKNRFDEKNNRTQEHYYFLSACPSQMPRSFVERMIFEILEDISDGDSDDPVKWWSDPDDKDRIEFHYLPLGHSLKKAQENFKKYCSEKLKFEEKDTFDDFLSGKLQKKKYKYLILPFFINNIDWDDFMLPYLEWIAASFRNRVDSGPTILFFLSIYHENLYDKNDKKFEKILNNIEAFAMERKGTASHFCPLHRVDIEDLKAWFFKIGKGKINTVHLNPIFDIIRDGLYRKEDQFLYDSYNKLNMDQIEIVQKMVYNAYQKQSIKKTI